MKDIAYRGVRVPVGRVKCALVSGGFAFLVWGAGWAIVGAHAAQGGSSIEMFLWASRCFVLARLLLLAALIIMTPQIVVPLGLVLAPFLTAMFAMEHEPWKEWWFWPGTALCELIGGYAMLKFIDRWKNASR